MQIHLYSADDVTGEPLLKSTPSAGDWGEAATFLRRQIHGLPSTIMVDGRTYLVDKLELVRPGLWRAWVRDAPLA